jgi:hypothetical protein
VQCHLLRVWPATEVTEDAPLERVVIRIHFCRVGQARPPCRVKVFITAVKLVRATDADRNDTLSWLPLIVEINGITNAAPPFFMGSPGGEWGGFPEGETFRFTDDDGNPIFGHLLFDEVVGKKGDDLSGRVELGVRETDLEVEHVPGVGDVRTGGASDRGALEAKLPKKLLFCTVRKFDVVAEVKIKHAKHPGFPRDPEDKHPPEHGLAEVHLHIDIDP